MVGIVLCQCFCKWCGCYTDIVRHTIDLALTDDPVDPVAMLVKPVIGELMLDIQIYNNATAEANRKSGNIQNSKETIPKEKTDDYFEQIGYHRVWFAVLSQGLCHAKTNLSIELNQGKSPKHCAITDENRPKSVMFPEIECYLI